MCFDTSLGEGRCDRRGTIRNAGEHLGDRKCSSACIQTGSVEKAGQSCT